MFCHLHLHPHLPYHRPLIINAIEAVTIIICSFIAIVIIIIAFAVTIIAIAFALVIKLLILHLLLQILHHHIHHLQNLKTTIAIVTKVTLAFLPYQSPFPHHHLHLNDAY